MKQSNGTIKIISKKGSGTIYIIYLPKHFPAAGQCVAFECYNAAKALSKCRDTDTQ